MGINVENWLTWDHGEFLQGWIDEYETYNIKNRSKGLNANGELEQTKEELKQHKLKHKDYYDSIK